MYDALLQVVPNGEKSFEDKKEHLEYDVHRSYITRHGIDFNLDVWLSDESNSKKVENVTLKIIQGNYFLSKYNSIVNTDIYPSDDERSIRVSFQVNYKNDIEDFSLSELKEWTKELSSELKKVINNLKKTYSHMREIGDL